MENLKSNPILLGLGAGILSSGIMFINNKYVEKEETINYSNLVKMFILTTLIVIGTLKMYNQTPSIVKEVKENVVESVNQTIHTGNPNF